MFQVDTNCREFKLALERLNTTLTLENIEALEKVGKMTNLPEDQILVGVGVHLIRQLTGTAETTWSRSQVQCPCKCGVKLDHSNTMYLGKSSVYSFVVLRDLIISSIFQDMRGSRKFYQGGPTFTVFFVLFFGGFF